MKRRPAGHSKPDSWDVNISFNLVANAKVEGLDVTPDNPIGYADKS